MDAASFVVGVTAGLAIGVAGTMAFIAITTPRRDR